MTEEEAREKAETRVYVYMSKGDIDYYFDNYGLIVRGKNGHTLKAPSRAAKEQALIAYYTQKMMETAPEKVEKQQKAFEDRFKHDVQAITHNK